MMDRILPAMDIEMTSTLLKEIKKKGIEVYLSTKVESFASENGKPYCTVSTGGRTERFYADKMLISIGRRSYTDGLGIENAGIAFNRKGIETDDRLKTSVPGIYAIGDCNGKTMLAHAASEQGSIAAENCMSAEKRYDGSVCPGCVYTFPEFAGVGLTEESAKEKGIDYVVGDFPLLQTVNRS
jgi:dihydrolipoamide dehydrogenase